MKMSLEQRTEQRAGRALQEMGLYLRKWTRNGEAGYCITNANNCIVYGGEFTLSLSDVQDFITEQRQ